VRMDDPARQAKLSQQRIAEDALSRGTAGTLSQPDGSAIRCAWVKASNRAKPAVAGRAERRRRPHEPRGKPARGEAGNRVIFIGFL